MNRKIRNIQETFTIYKKRSQYTRNVHNNLENIFFQYMRRLK